MIMSLVLIIEASLDAVMPTIRECCICRKTYLGNQIMGGNLNSGFIFLGKSHKKPKTFKYFFFYISQTVCTYCLISFECTTKMKNMLMWMIAILLFMYLLTGCIVYIMQEKLIFYPAKLPSTYTFHFPASFQEHTVQTKDGTILHGLLFKVPAPKGVIFYLHGNAGALDSWGTLAERYTSFQYDLFMLDYRGFGKSEGRLEGEKQFYSDVQAAYAHIKTLYQESDIIVVGFSIGSAAAAMLAATNHPKRLILQAPYYSLRDLMKQLMPVLYWLMPPFILKYPFNTYQYVGQTRAPVVIFHGDQDEVIYYGSSLKLKQHFKATDELIILAGVGHNGINDNSEFIRKLKDLLL